MKIQRMLGDGVTWADVTNVAPLLDKVLEREPWYAPRRGRTPMTTHAEVLAWLGESARNTINYGIEYYEMLRDADAPRKPRPARTLTLCDCGHESPSPMTTARGTACAACYDNQQ